MGVATEVPVTETISPEAKSWTLRFSPGARTVSPFPKFEYRQIRP